jgi:sugar lactone lactonase YvrE
MRSSGGKKSARGACALALAMTIGALLMQAAPALAVPACPGAATPRTLLTGQPLLESVIVGPDGRLYYTVTDKNNNDTDQNAVMVLDFPGATPRVFAGGITGPGGMVFDADGRLVVGYGDSIPTGVLGNLVGKAGLLSIDTQTGARRTLATGLSMANGVARASDGTFYASQDVGLSIDRIRNGVVQQRWATVVSSNGLVIDSTGRYLFAAQTFVPAAIQRIDLTDPTKKLTWFHAKPLDWSAGFDGMTRDARDRLFVAANGGQQVWRINRDRTACALTPKLGLLPAQGPSALAFGAATGPFPADSLYVVTFNGRLLEIPHATDAPPATSPG